MLSKISKSNHQACINSFLKVSLCSKNAARAQSLVRRDRNVLTDTVISPGTPSLLF